MKSYVILFRGINVGGKNPIPMALLKIMLEELGFRNVRTYINSGNAIIATDRSPEIIKRNIEDALPKRFEPDSESIKILVLSRDYVASALKNAPTGFGTQPSKYHTDLIFLIDISVDDAMKVFDPREGVDRIWPGEGVIYSQRLSELRTKSRLSKVMGTPAYKSMTIRTYGTVTKLLALLDQQPTG